MDPSDVQPRSPHRQGKQAALQWRYHLLLERLLGPNNVWVGGRNVGLWRGLRIRISRRRENYAAEAFFRDKAVVIVGPNCQRDDQLVARVQAADLLVFVNKGYQAPFFRQLKPHAKKAVLFHCLAPANPNKEWYSTWDFRRKGFREVFYPLDESCYESFVSRFHLRNWASLPLYRISRESYAELKGTIQGFRPNLGYAAIWTIVKGGCRSLYVSGMDFLRQAYAGDYHAHLKTLDQIVAGYERARSHNPDLDLESFRQLIREHPVVACDAVLTEILSRPTERLFYRNKDSQCSLRTQKISNTADPSNP